MDRCFAALIVGTIGYASVAFAQPTPPLAIIDQQDAQDVMKIFDEQVPPRWSKPVVDWLNRLVARQAEKIKVEAEKAKAAEQVEPSTPP